MHRISKGILAVGIAAAVLMSAVFLMGSGGPGTAGDLMFARSMYDTMSPAVAVDDRGSPVLAWQEDERIRVATVNMGTGWLEGIQDIDDLAGVSSAPSIHMEARGSRVVIVWRDCCAERGGGVVLAAAISTDRGRTFSDNLFVPANGPQGFDTASNADGDVYVVWQEAGVGGGARLGLVGLLADSTAFTIPYTMGVTGGNSPTIAATGDDVYLAWIEGRGGLRLRRSSDGGESFDHLTDIDIPYDVTPYDPHLAARGERVHLVWSSYEESRVHLRYAYSTDYGVTFSSSGDLTEPQYGSTDFDADVTIGLDGKLYIAWAGREGHSAPGSRIHMKSSIEGVSQWTDVPLPEAEGEVDEESPRIAVDGSGDYFVTHEQVAWDYEEYRRVARLLTNSESLRHRTSLIPPHPGVLAVALVPLVTTAAIAVYSARRLLKRSPQQS